MALSESMVLVNGVEMDTLIVDKVTKTIDRIDKQIGAIAKGYLKICGDVAYLKDNKAWLVSGHKNLYDLCADKFGMARGTVSNLISIYQKYGEDYKLPAEIQSRKITDLLAEIKAEKQEALGVDDSSDSATVEKTRKQNNTVTATFDLVGGSWELISFLQYINDCVQEGDETSEAWKLKNLHEGQVVTITISDR